MKTPILILLLMLCFVLTASAQTHPSAEDVMADLEAQYVPNLVLEVDDDVAFDLRSGRSIPADMLAALPNAAYEALLPVPSNPDHEAIWRSHGLHRWFKVTNLDESAIRSLSPASLTSLESVAAAEFSNLHVAHLTPMDTGNYNVWAMDVMQATEAWDYQVGSDEIIVTTIDTGCEVNHPDLQHNMRINPAEDLNNNGIWDASDSNGIDDDGNGFVDDLLGWDFVSANVSGLFQAPGEDYAPRDNRVWPDIVGHGTHVAGTSGSATNNAGGVPSASWNVSNMPLRAGYAYNFLFFILGVGDTVDFVAAIQYAAENGSDIVSISFGGTGSNQFYQDTINFARSMGVLVFASAGNSNNQTINYPAGYNNVISVAATTVNDVRASFSTYGSWVDISAPGQNIWSTVPSNQGSYDSYDGTSMASPNAAAVAALVKSYNPAMSVGDLESYILDGADNIDAQNPGYIGLLGSGRINALNSLMLARADYAAPTSPNLDIVPLVSPTNVPAAGGAFGFNVTISNNTGSAQTFDAWASAILPDGTNYGPIISQSGLFMGSDETMMFTLSQNVPGVAQAGSYSFMVNLGDLNAFPDETDRLTVNKANAAVATRVHDWEGYGWPSVAGDTDSPALPTRFEVGQAYPNPFNGSTNLSVVLPDRARLSVEVFDVLGRSVATVENSVFSAGKHMVSIDASRFASGMYFVRTSASGFGVQTQKIMLMK